MGFTGITDQIALLRSQIVATESQLSNLRAQLSAAESRVETARQLEQAYQGGFPAEWIGETLSALTSEDLHGLPGYAAATPGGAGSPDEIARSIRQESGRAEKEFVPAPGPVRSRWPLSGEEYKRYGRQMIMKEVGLHGQLRLKQAKVLVVGCGGLGCPAAAYLAGAGVGTIGLMDGDTVEASNLHRQIAHSTSRVGQSKVDSAYEYLREYVERAIHMSANKHKSLIQARLNPLPNYERHPFHLSPNTALDVFSAYDLVLDCTDHPTSRYLISDACVLAGKPLVSASALKTEGQLIVLNNPPKPPGDLTGGPCYRCIFPKPPPADSVLSCGEGGILGPVVGVMGVLQALEAIKLLTSSTNPATNDFTILSFNQQESPRASMLLFSAYSNPQFRTVRMRTRHASCAACSSMATIHPQQLTDGLLDYAAFCGLTHPINLLSPQARITARDFARLPRDGSNILIDVRDETQYAMCALRGSINVPWPGNGEKWIEAALQKGALSIDPMGRQMFVVCRYGNDSQLAVKAVQDLTQRMNGGGPSGTNVNVRDIRGGFRAWRQEVDGEWPEY